MESNKDFDIGTLKLEIDAFLDNLSDAEFYDSLLAAGYDAYKDMEHLPSLHGLIFTADPAYTIVCESSISINNLPISYLKGFVAGSIWTQFNSKDLACSAILEAA